MKEEGKSTYRDQLSLYIERKEYADGRPASSKNGSYLNYTYPGSSYRLEGKK